MIQVQVSTPERSEIKQTRRSIVAKPGIENKKLGQGAKK